MYKFNFTKYQTIQLVLSFISLVLGGLIYVLYRQKSIIFLSFIANHTENRMTDIRSNINLSQLADWIIYSLPDGLWLFSYMLFVDCLWQKSKSRLFWILILPIIAILWEFGQKASICQGTFDINDLLSYLIVVIIFLLISKLKNMKKKTFKHAISALCLFVFLGMAVSSGEQTSSTNSETTQSVEQKIAGTYKYKDAIGTDITLVLNEDKTVKLESVMHGDSSSITQSGNGSWQDFSDYISINIIDNGYCFIKDGNLYTDYDHMNAKVDGFPITKY
jgi:hypothetical protein